jgi:hypothetical protein
MHYTLNYLPPTFVSLYIQNIKKRVSNKNYETQFKLFYDIASYNDYANYLPILGSIPGRGKNILSPTTSIWLWNPPRLLFNEYAELFPGGKAAEA